MKKSDSLPSGAGLRAAHLIERLGKLLRGADHAGGLAPAQWEALRYLARANRFSRTPAALADFAGTTRGTASQTLIALEAKGYVTKGANDRDARSVRLDLTAAGSALLAKSDPILTLARDIDAGEDARALAQALEQTLRHALTQRNQRAFGQCKTCRHFRATVRDGKTPNHCALIDTGLSHPDSELLCVEHTD